MGFSALDETINARRQKIRKNTAQASSCDSGGGGRADRELVLLDAILFLVRTLQPAVSRNSQNGVHWPLKQHTVGMSVERLFRLCGCFKDHIHLTPLRRPQRPSRAGCECINALKVDWRFNR